MKKIVVTLALVLFVGSYALPVAVSANSIKSEIVNKHDDPKKKEAKKSDTEKKEKSAKTKSSCCKSKPACSKSK